MSHGGRFSDEDFVPRTPRASELPPAQPSPGPKKPATTAVQPSSWWLVLYSGLLFLLISAYYGVLFWAIFELASLLYRAWPRQMPAQGEDWLWVGVAAACVILLIRFAAHLWRAVEGLVTARHDGAVADLEGVPLNKERHADLYSLVAETAKIVGAPMPDEIRVTHHAECYAVEQREFALRTQRKLILVLGLPHLEIFTVEELKVILAHELSHLGRGDTRLGVFCYRFLESLRDSRTYRHWRWLRWIDPIFWFSSLYFYGFMLLSAPIFRHQELRADCLSATAFGGELAARTLLKDWLLVNQFESAVASYEKRRQLDGLEGQDDPDRDLNVFRHFVEQWRDFSPEGQDYLYRRLALEERSSFWDSHPTIQSRIDRMRSFPDRQPTEDEHIANLLHDLKELENELHKFLFVERDVKYSLRKHLRRRKYLGRGQQALRAWGR